MLRIAIQTKGRLNEQSIDLLHELGIDVDAAKRKFLSKASNFPIEVLYLRDFLKIMMRADVEAYNNCFNEVYYKTHKKQEAFSQQMIYEAEIRFGGETKKENGERTVIYYLLYKLYENDGSLRRDVGSDAVVPMIVELRITPAGEISINALESTRTK